LTYLPRDFVETGDGLLFAVVDQSDDEEHVPCFLRYASSNGRTRKLGTDEANELLGRRFPHYLYHCELRDADLHGVPRRDLIRHLRPRCRIKEILEQDCDSFEARVARLVSELAAAGVPESEIGVTGSVLAGLHQTGSDIDLVLYDAEIFARARLALAGLIRRGRLAPLDEGAWRQAYERRGCSLTFAEYLWHERRKLNKALFEGTKLDLSLVVPKSETRELRWRKLGSYSTRARVTDDQDAFDYPSRLGVKHDQVRDLVSFTATYSGQGQRGEVIEASGLLEESEDGARRIVVGSDREAVGQYIKVVG
jgi:hypothetical protein